MELRLNRKFLGDSYTIGDLFINNVFYCNTIEDKVRDLNKDGDLLDIGESKIYGETAIPYGKYKIIVTMSPKFSRELPRLLDVPHFEGILIHRGNYGDYTKVLKTIPIDKKFPLIPTNTKLQVL